MGRQRSLWVDKANEIIGWEWMELEPILTALAPLVPPGAAVRFVEQVRATNHRRRVPISDKRYPTRTRPTGTAMVRNGQRARVRSDIANHQQKVNGRNRRIYEIANHDGVYYIRRLERREACNCRDCPERRQ